MASQYQAHGISVWKDFSEEEEKCGGPVKDIIVSVTVASRLLLVTIASSLYY
jgi:hypothetical protein